MAPKFLKYEGIEVGFYSNDHLPIHVHCNYGEYEIKVEFYLKNKEIVKIAYVKVANSQEFPSSKLKTLKQLIEKYKYIIVQNWISFYVLGEKISAIKVSKIK